MAGLVRYGELSPGQEWNGKEWHGRLGKASRERRGLDRIGRLGGTSPGLDRTQLTWNGTAGEDGLGELRTGRMWPDVDR